MGNHVIKAKVREAVDVLNRTNYFEVTHIVRRVMPHVRVNLAKAIKETKPETVYDASGLTIIDSQRTGEAA